MSDGVIFLVQPGDTLVRMEEAPYESESLLQHLLAQYPDILAGEQIDTRAPRRWLLVSREYGVPATDDGVDRWSIDHLFLDQDGVPTLVEVKRSSDTRIRREVVGQMLDYAANAVLHWPVTTIAQRLEERCRDEGIDIGDALAHVTDDDDAETFWQNVKTNLEAGRVRLVFVADKIPEELRTIVAFLAKQLDPAEAFAIEVKQYVGTSTQGTEPLRNLVPRLVAGRQPEPVGVSVRGRWTAERFFHELQSAHPEVVAVARKLADLGVELTRRALEPGSGTESGSLTARMRLNGVPVALFSIYTTGELSFNLGWNTRLNELGDDLSEKLRAQAERHGFLIDPHGWGVGWNKTPLTTVEGKLDSFESFMRSTAQQLRDLAAKPAT